MWQKLRPRLGRLVLVLVVVSLVAGIMFGKDLVPYWGAFVLDRHVEEFLAEPKEPSRKLAPRIIGKVVPIDVKKRRVSEVYYELPAELRATSADEVGTIVWLDWTETKAGEEERLTVHSCRVTLIDRDTKEASEPVVFRVSGPPDRKTSTRGILEYLTHLPRYPRSK